MPKVIFVRFYSFGIIIEDDTIGDIRTPVDDVHNYYMSFKHIFTFY